MRFLETLLVSLLIALGSAAAVAQDVQREDVEVAEEAVVDKEAEAAAKAAEAELKKQAEEAAKAVAAEAKAAAEAEAVKVAATEPANAETITEPVGSDDASANAGLAGIGLFVLALGIFVIYNYLKKMPSDQQMDDWINEDLEATKRKSLSKIGIDESELVHEQIVIVGPRLESTGGAEMHFKAGKDKMVRYTPMNVTVLNMTANQLIAYNCCLDLTTGNQLQESTDEYFYRDVVSVSTKTSSFTMKFSTPATLPGGGKIDQMQFNSGERFELSTSGGNAISVFLRDEKWQEQLGGKIWSLDVDKAVQAVRKMLREKKA